MSVEASAAITESQLRIEAWHAESVSVDNGGARPVLHVDRADSKCVT